jgi:hypothetical protein
MQHAALNVRMHAESLYERSFSLRDAENWLTLGTGTLLLLVGASRRSAVGECLAVSSAPLLYRADLARVGFDAMTRGDGDVVSGWKNKRQSAIANITAARVLGQLHRKMAEPGSAQKAKGSRRHGRWRG